MVRDCHCRRVINVLKKKVVIKGLYGGSEDLKIELSVMVRVCD
jgi:hypothetical protein